jgi:endonuclease YncB( thermonuclease family)
MMAYRTILLLVACLLLPSEIRAIESSEIYRGISGPVISVLDGDTLEVLHNRHPERIRLNGIDCPEKVQAFGKRAKQAASALAFGKEVTLQTHGYDKYKPTLGDVILPDARCEIRGEMGGADSGSVRIWL